MWYQKQGSDTKRNKQGESSIGMTGPALVEPHTSTQTYSLDCNASIKT